MQAVQAQLQQFQRDIDYFAAHEEELVRQCPDRWVAVFNENVVGDDPDLERLLDRLQEQDIPIENALVRHLTAKEELFILCQ